jgi:GNAT superfamily N-acetyltransferase
MDMLVKLYAYSSDYVFMQALKEQGVDIRPAIAPEKHVVLNWVREHFGEGWASECDVAFSNTPVSCIIAVKDGKMLGFSCYDATCLDFFGPTGVAQEERGHGYGKALLYAALDAMKAKGYGYAVIGSAGPKDFYRKCCGAEIIEGSSPGIYKGMLR